MIYFGVSSGIAMEIHYCMGERAGVDFYVETSSKCGKCGMKETKGGCCSDEHQFYKLADAHKHITNDLDLGIQFSDIPSYHSLIPKPVEDKRLPLLSSALSPPPRQVPIYLFDKVFRL